jgi:FAD synthase
LPKYGEVKMSKANILTIRVPSDLKNRIARVAEEQGVSINQLAMYMFTKELGNIEAGQYMSNFLQGYSKKEILSGFDDVMSKVKKTTSSELG